MDGEQLAPERSQESLRQLAAALSLIQRLPPQDLEQNLDGFAQIDPHLEQALLPYVTRPLRLQRDAEHNRYFVACEYNCDGGAHRSPWSNRYFPPPDPETEERLFHPSERLRRLEETSNEVFDTYKTSYYEGGVSSVYLWELDEGFAGAFIIRKELSEDPKASNRGVWDSVHVLEVRELPNSNYAEYKLSSSVRLHLQTSEQGSSETELAGLVTRQAESRRDVRKQAGEDFHLIHIGRMIEEMEISIRQNLDSLYVAKQREVLNATRSFTDLA